MQHLDGGVSRHRSPLSHSVQTFRGGPCQCTPDSTAAIIGVDVSTVGTPEPSAATARAVGCVPRRRKESVQAHPVAAFSNIGPMELLRLDTILKMVHVEGYGPPLALVA